MKTLDRLKATAEAERRDPSEIIRFACEPYRDAHEPTAKNHKDR
jgi:hypothetical protein